MLMKTDNAFVDCRGGCCHSRFANKIWW